MGLLLGILWFGFWVWALRRGYRFITDGLGRAMSGDWGAALRGSTGREWNAADFSRLSRLDAAQAAIAPPDLNDVNGDLERMLHEEESCARELQEAIAKRNNLVAQLKANARDWREKAQVAVAKGRDDLARAALMEVQRFESGAAESEKAVQELQPILDSYNEEIVQLRRRLSEGLNRKLLAEARMVRAQHGERANRLLDDTGEQRLDDAAYRLERQADVAEGNWQAQKLAGGFGRKRVDAPVSVPPPPAISVETEKRWDAAIENQLADLKRRQAGAA